MHKSLLCVVVAFCLGASYAIAQSAGPQAGQKVAFMGDSITQFGFQNPGGYVNLIAMGMEKAGKKIEVIPAGVSGNTSRDMIARLKRDVLDKKPDWMTLSCGVNDVWHGEKGCTLDEYQKNITAIVDQATAAGIKVVILTATMIQETPANDFNQKLIPYNEFLHKLAADKNLPIADLNADMQAALTAGKTEVGTSKTGFHLTVDGVHMNGLGNEMMAAGVLKAFGLTDAQIADAKEAWLDVPGSMPMPVTLPLTVREYIQLRKVGDSKGTTVDKMVGDAVQKDVQKDVQDFISATPAPAPAPAPAKP